MTLRDKGKARPQGQIRQSQVITTFGPGAMLDLPNCAVIVGGLESWEGDRRPIIEDRLLANIQRWLGIPGLKLYAPPIESSDPDGPRTGIAAWQFPAWFVAQHNEPWGDAVRSRAMVHFEGLQRGKFVDRDRAKHKVLPIRFVQACKNGHISDIDWGRFVHLATPSRLDCRRQLWMDERGSSGELADIRIRCECGAERSMADATKMGEDGLGFCRGFRPWLGLSGREPCVGDNGVGDLNRLLIRSASNAYFPQVATVISIPDSDADLKKAVGTLWDDYLQYCESLADLERERKKAKVAAALEGLSGDTVFAEIERRRGGSETTTKGVKQPEIAVLMSSDIEKNEDIPDTDFFARQRSQPLPSSGAASVVERVVLVHRLREVVAQVGFTRFEAAMPDVDGELSLEVRRASLAADLSWLPAVENRGEGVFLAIRAGAIDDWLARPEVRARARQFLDGLKAWESRHPGAKQKPPGLPFVMIHSLSHLLITAVALECGYAASSIRERVYATGGSYGILLYTGSPDAEGTLGGLVQIGRRIEHHLDAALELGRLCSNDPVCAQHQPQNAHEERFLHGAACHGCLLIAEPSCERHNEFLDRALVVPTVEGLGAEFFTDLVS